MRRALVLLVIAVPIAVAYWPGLHGFWTRDDFMQLAFARLIGSPWPLFVHDHYFPVPGSLFRPLGFASFWLWQALFGTRYFDHALGDLALHIGVALALYGLIRTAVSDRMLAVLCALLFALHPAVLGTALWWSARFDLLAALFVFIAVRAALDYSERPHGATLAVALVGTLLALLSKETALAGVIATAFVWLRWAVRDRVHRNVALRAFAALVIVLLLFFVWRALVIGTVATGLAGDASLTSLIGSGVVKWFGAVAGYLSYWARLDAAARCAFIAIAILLVLCVALAARKNDGDPTGSRDLDVFVCGLCLFIVPALLQAPVAALNAAALRSDMSAVEAAMQSRLYNLCIGGLVAMAAVVLRRALARAPAWRIPVLGVVALGVVALGWTSRVTSSAYASVTAAPRPMAEAAAAAVDAIDGSAGPCHVVLLGAEPPPEWSIYVSMDAVVKALSQRAATDRCFIHSDYPTFFNLMDRGVTSADARPYRPREMAGRPLAWLPVGDALVAYLDAPASDDREVLESLRFLRYEDGAFRDVTAAVRDGRIHVELR